MPNLKLDPDPQNPTEVVSVRLTRDDLARVRTVARAADRPIRAQCRVLIREALNLSASQANREDK